MLERRRRGTRTAYFGAVTVALFLLAAGAAAIDWVAVWQRFFRIEYVCKPLVLALLIAAAASAELPLVKGWVLAALLLGLAGDIALLASGDETGRLDAAFLAGLAAFLAGNVCYLAAFARIGQHGLQAAAGALVVAGVSGLALPRILARVRRIGGRELLAVVGAYAAVLAAMAVLAAGTGRLLTALGGVLFLASDTALAHDRFVRPVRHGPLLVIVSYHLAQALLLLGVIRR
jgi:uncharacterized membrane protein YhhN